MRLKAALAVLERPRFPNPGWQLPAETGSRQERQIMADLGYIEADYKRMRMTEAVREPQARDLPYAPAVARNATCPCGSGLKYKRCGGVGAGGCRGTPPATAGSGASSPLALGSPPHDSATSARRA